MAMSLVEAQSDEELVEAARMGDSDAVARLWERHAPAGRRAARAVTTAFDADDLVSEAFASILHAIKNGHGPRGPFRPYLFRAIRNVAAEWGGKNREVLVEDMSLILDRSSRHTEANSPGDAIVAAFKHVPERWRTLLWYMEVEGMRPREIAPLMGMTPNGVSALAVRARQGFRKAWLEAIVASGERPEECRWVCDRIVRVGNKPIARRDSPRYDSHLEQCEECALILAEANGLSLTLRAVLLPLVIGGGAAAALMAETAAPAAALGLAGSAEAASRPSWFGFGGVAAGAGVAATAAAAVLLANGVWGSTGGSVSAPPAVLLQPARAIVSTSPASPKVVTTSAPVVPAIVQTVAPAAPTSPAAILVTTTTAVWDAHGALRPGLPTPTTAPSAPAGLSFTNIAFNQPVPPLLVGLGTPGATIQILDETGVVLAETVVDAAGNFSADVSGDLLHQGMSLTLVQTIEGGATEALEPIGPFVFPVPSIFSPDGSLPEHLVDGDGDGVLDDAPVPILGIPGESVQILLDGVEVQILTLDASTGTGYLLDVANGSHALGLRYVTPETGRTGVATETHFVVGGSGHSDTSTFSPTPSASVTPEVTPTSTTSTTPDATASTTPEVTTSTTPDSTTSTTPDSTTSTTPEITPSTTSETSPTAAPVSSPVPIP